MDNNDSQELQDLFDKIANDKHQELKKDVVITNIVAENDSQELQDLFDNIVNANNKNNSVEHNILNDVGKVARIINSGLSNAGESLNLDKTQQFLPDTKDRLIYISKITEDSANTVLNCLDTIIPIHKDITSRVDSIQKRWDLLFANKLSVNEFRTLAFDTFDLLKLINEKHLLIENMLIEIMMSQNFQDLTGQVIKKILTLINDVEKELLNILIHYSNPDKINNIDNNLLDGPQIKNTNAINTQAEVDDLLSSLGF